MKVDYKKHKNKKYSKRLDNNNKKSKVKKYSMGV